jgi:tubulin-specific chaperone E
LVHNYHRSLKTLNGAAVSAMERRDCEIRYIRNVEAERLAAGRAPADTAALHPRYPELSTRFAGWLLALTQEGGSGAGAQAASLAAAMVTLRLTCVSAERGAVMGTHEKRLPASLTLDKLKVLCEKLFKVRPLQSVLLSLHVQFPFLTFVTRYSLRPRVRFVLRR